MLTRSDISDFMLENIESKQIEISAKDLNKLCDMFYKFYMCYEKKNAINDGCISVRK